MAKKLTWCLAAAVLLFNLAASADNPKCHDGIYRVFKGKHDNGSVYKDGNNDGSGELLKALGWVTFTCAKNDEEKKLTVEIREHLKYAAFFKFRSCRTEEWKDSKIKSYTSRTLDHWNILTKLSNRGRNSCSPYKDLPEEIIVTGQLSNESWNNEMWKEGGLFSEGTWEKVPSPAGDCTVGADSYPANLWNPLLNPGRTEWDGHLRAIDQISGEPRCWGPKPSDGSEEAQPNNTTSICESPKCTESIVARRFDLQPKGGDGKPLRTVWYDDSGRWLKLTEEGKCGDATVVLWNCEDESDECKSVDPVPIPKPDSLECPMPPEPN